MIAVLKCSKMITKIAKTILCVGIGLLFVLIPIDTVEVYIDDGYRCKAYQPCPDVMPPSKEVIIRGFPFNYSTLEKGDWYRKEESLNSIKTLPLVTDFALGVLTGLLLITGFSKAKSKFTK